MSRPFRLYASLAACIILASLSGFAQETTTPVAPSPADMHTDSSEGLKIFLNDALGAAKSGNKLRLKKDIQSTEIPHYAKFFPTMWPGPGESWVAPYGNDLQANQVRFGNLLTYLEHLGGELTVRKVNDEPEGGRGMEWGMLHGLQQPLDIYFAGWKVVPETPDDQHTLPIGYFFYVDGGFRLDSNVMFVTKVVHTVAPVYPYPLDESSPKGSVQLLFTLNNDGTVLPDSIHPTQNPRMSTDPKLIQAAKDAVAHYRYMPPDLFKIKMNDMMEIVNLPPGTPPPALGPPTVVLLPKP